MERAYNNGTKDDVTFFVGTEVEHTPVYGKTTLFVVGLHNPDKVAKLAEDMGIEHIYLGANQSFNNTNLMFWEAVINELLKRDFWVTLDFDISYYNDIIDNLTAWNEYDRFITQISVKLPYATLLNYNTCIKIDDSGFRETNPGVWVHQLHDLQDRSKFTDWSKYTQDKPLVITDSPSETVTTTVIDSIFIREE
jgi:hypothetical protein